MNANTKEYVIRLLEGYADTAHKIALLRYELEHPALITPDEMIDALSFAKGVGYNRQRIGGNTTDSPKPL